MGSFKTWINESGWTDAAIHMGQAVNAFVIDDPETKAKAAQFKQEFDKFNAFVKKYDYIGLARAFQITAVGYPKIVFDFCSCLYNKITGKGDCNVKNSMMNVAKILPASILMGTAKFAVPFAMGVEVGGMVAMGITVIQYLYWPFWIWASNNLENQDPKKAKAAQVILSAIPDQFKQMLAVSKPPEVKEWLKSQMVLMSEHNPVFGELV